LEEIVVRSGELLEQRSLLVNRLKNPILMWSKLLQLSFEYLRVLRRDGFLV
jgi:hypothetical protein